MPIQDISIIERAIADPLSRERLGRALSRRHSEVRAVLDPAFEGFFEARLGQRADISSISGERRLALAAYAKLAY